MATTDTDLHHASRVFQALSDQTRLHILQMLAGGERCVCDLQGAVGAYQSRLSFHLRKLKDAGLVTDRKEGRWVYYTLRSEVLADLEQYLSRLQTGAEARPVPTSECCG